MKKDKVIEYNGLLIITNDEHTVVINDELDVARLSGRYHDACVFSTYKDRPEAFRHAITVYHAGVKSYYHYLLDNNLTIVDRVKTLYSTVPETLGKV